MGGQAHRLRDEGKLREQLGEMVGLALDGLAELRWDLQWLDTVGFEGDGDRFGDISLAGALVVLLRAVPIIILDGEATPEGGMGVARQLKDEVFNCPPVLLLVARKEDAWLAAWSRAEASVTHPVDPFTLANTVADLIRARSIAIA